MEVDLAPIIWKLLANDTVTVDDLEVCMQLRGKQSRVWAEVSLGLNFAGVQL